MEEIQTIDSLEWTFSFGKYKNKSVLEAIEENPSFFSDGILDINNIRKGKGLHMRNHFSLISYLEWTEKERILKITTKTWKEIKNYDNLYTSIESYENGNKEGKEEQHIKKLKEIYKIRYYL
ncbi:hypothetical protein [Polaribacter atrinae]|uniref:hypothetical protein n=1 Tax=Polaribacter atrinae TaxID=1333662 RepID=UPI0030FB4D0D